MRILVPLFDIPTTASVLSLFLSPSSATMTSFNRKGFMKFLTLQICFFVAVSTILPCLSAYYFRSCLPSFFVTSRHRTPVAKHAPKLEIHIIYSSTYLSDFFGSLPRNSQNIPRETAFRNSVGIAGLYFEGQSLTTDTSLRNEHHFSSNILCF